MRAAHGASDIVACARCASRALANVIRLLSPGPRGSRQYALQGVHGRFQITEVGSVDADLGTFLGAHAASPCRKPSMSEVAR
jgi:hypothetical protein